MFHCQQAAEKYLKAYLVSFNIDSPKTHELDKQCLQCAKKDNRFVELADECLFLMEYAVITRYPHELDINEHHVKRAFGKCRND